MQEGRLEVLAVEVRIGLLLARFSVSVTIVVIYLRHL